MFPGKISYIFFNFRGGDLVAKWGNNTFGMEISLFLIFASKFCVWWCEGLSHVDLLQCDYYNPGHLDKADQLDDRKITIHSKKVSSQSWLPQNEINNMDQNYNREVTFWTCWRKLKNVSISSCYIFHLRLQVIAMHGNCSKEISGRWQKSSFCQPNVSPGC